MIGFRRKIDVIVYTMGKVGSSTVSTSLKAAGLHCLDIHVLAPERIAPILEQHLNHPSFDEIPEHIIDAILAHNATKRQSAVRIITLIRNPIMRNISAVFQNSLPESACDFGAVLTSLRAYPVRIPDHWFEKDFIPATGIDVFAEDVDPASDHYRFANDKFDILMLKLESDDARKSALISEFVGQEIKLTRTNEAAKKAYYEIYRKIADDPRAIGDSYIEECLNLKYFRKLYSGHEIAEFSARLR
jgi:hypothetical protein